jgi:SAM-dependent methyltransferase
MLKTTIDHLTDVADYYTAKLTEHGETALGVDWNSEQSQALRFQQLSKIIDTHNHFSINDIGCGYAALYDHLTTRYDSLSYFGIDVSEAMIATAKRRCLNEKHTHFRVSSEPNQVADFSIASGIFNVRLNRSSKNWQTYLENTLDLLNRFSRYGFSFNCLTEYSDANKMRETLYYANPGQLFDYCKRRYSRNIALLHDYDLYEFTILVRKQV